MTALTLALILAGASLGCSVLALALGAMIRTGNPSTETPLPARRTTAVIIALPMRGGLVDRRA